MHVIHKSNSLTWVHLTNPDQEDIKNIASDYNLHLQTAEELLSNTVIGKVDFLDKYIYLVLHFPIINRDLVTSQEVDCVLTSDTLISVSYEEIPAITELERQIDANDILQHTAIGDHAGYLLYHLLTHLYKSVTDALVVNEHKLDHMEDRIFSGNQRDMVRTLSEEDRILLDTLQILQNHKSVLPALEAAGIDKFGQSFQYRLRRIVGDHKRATSKVEQLRETLRELRHTNDSLLTTSQNEVMKVFTIMAFLTFPLSLLAGIFGMDTVATPIIGHPQDFWIIVGSMLVLAVAAFAYFRYKKWI